MLSVERHEAYAFLVEEEFDFAGSAAAVLRENKVGDILAISIFVIVIFAVDEHNNVRILLDGTGFAEV